MHLNQFPKHNFSKIIIENCFSNLSKKIKKLVNIKTKTISRLLSEKEKSIFLEENNKNNRFFSPQSQRKNLKLNLNINTTNKRNISTRCSGLSSLYNISDIENNVKEIPDFILNINRKNNLFKKKLDLLENEVKRFKKFYEKIKQNEKKDSKNKIIENYIKREKKYENSMNNFYDNSLDFNKYSSAKFIRKRPLEKSRLNIIESSSGFSEDNYFRKQKNSILDDNPLLLYDKNHLQYYYNIKVNKQRYITLLKDKSFRYLNKIKDILDLKKLSFNKYYNKSLINLETKKYNFNAQKRINEEISELNEKQSKQLLKDKLLSLKNIKLTLNTIETLNKKKTYLDDDIKLFFKKTMSTNNKQTENKLTLSTLYSPVESNRSIEDKNNNKNINIDKYINKSINNNISNIINNKTRSLAQSKTIIPKYINIHEGINTKVNTKKQVKFIKSNQSEPVFEIRKYKRNRSLNFENKKELLFGEDKKNLKIDVLYEKIKGKNLVNHKSVDLIKNYYKKNNKNIIPKFDDTPQQLLRIVNNSLYRIKKYNVEKETKKIFGYAHYDAYHILKNHQKSIDESFYNFQKTLIKIADEKKTQKIQ